MHIYSHLLETYSTIQQFHQEINELCVLGGSEWLEWNIIFEATLSAYKLPPLSLIDSPNYHSPATVDVQALYCITLPTSTRGEEVLYEYKS
ncbi:hypothetical protein RSOLAG1IB_01648 [Rhizoctonia solani AG-1 IB]|uniref:Uncharacterized protein n=1 Tax=Thanatephorus cucumeris (strain AG1-IB / isolate 7/3/14) TaxID=1108050 RepID=A0A0B7FC95_THACB|nr:hypothetical protein RSOLAG1IB_01648 [Rhizoctonia solani AG-1 IB]